MRELQNVIERAVILSGGDRLTLELGAEEGTEQVVVGQVHTDREAPNLTLQDLQEMERDLIRRTLEGCRWKIYGDDGAAAELALNPTTLASRMKRFGIVKP